MPKTCAPPSAYPLPGVPSGGGPSGAPWSGVQPACVSSAVATPDPKHTVAQTVTSAVTDANSLRILTPACSTTRLCSAGLYSADPAEACDGHQLGSAVQPNELVLPV